jgi:hypothetical protein
VADYMNGSDKAGRELDALDRAENAEQGSRRQLWDRQPGESPKAFNAFRLYRDAMEKRTLAKVAETLGCSSTNVERWARRWAWTQRTYEFDLVEEEKFREQMARDRVAHRRRQIQIGQAVQIVAVAGLREWQMKLDQKLPLNLDPDEVAKLLKLGDELETRGLGEDQGAGRFTRIIVNLGEAPPLPDALEASSSVLCDDTTGEGSKGLGRTSKEAH